MTSGSYLMNNINNNNALKLMILEKFTRGWLPKNEQIRLYGLTGNEECSKLIEDNFSTYNYLDGLIEGGWIYNIISNEESTALEFADWKHLYKLASVSDNSIMKMICIYHEDVETLVAYTNNLNENEKSIITSIKNRDLNEFLALEESNMLYEHKDLMDQDEGFWSYALYISAKYQVYNIYKTILSKKPIDPLFYMISSIYTFELDDFMKALYEYIKKNDGDVNRILIDNGFRLSILFAAASDNCDVLQWCFKGFPKYIPEIWKNPTNLASFAINNSAIDILAWSVQQGAKVNWNTEIHKLVLQENTSFIAEILENKLWYCTVTKLFCEVAELFIMAEEIDHVKLLGENSNACDWEYIIIPAVNSKNVELVNWIRSHKSIDWSIIIKHYREKKLMDFIYQYIS
jgi:hypothetical protein